MGMSKFGKFGNDLPGREAKKAPMHPIWRGIGCVLLVLIPVMSYAGAVLLVQENFKQHWIPVARELTQTVAVPLVGNVPNLYAYLVVAVLLTLAGFGILTIIFGIMTNMVGGTERTDPYYVPPERREKRRRR